MIDYIEKDTGKEVKAVPENAFIITRNCLKSWLKEAERKREFAIADHDAVTAEIKLQEISSFRFALEIIKRVERYGEDADAYPCGED